jgi:hypothetical protein
MYVGTLGGGVLRSTDGGASWVSLDAGLANPSVLPLATDAATGMLYAGTQGGGVFQLLPVVDVPTTHWAWSSIEAAYAAGLTAGCGVAPPAYCPERPTTRAQKAVLLLRASEGAGFTPPACTTAPFADVPCTDPFAPWIGELARRGITVGCGDGNHCPADATTREQMAVLLLRARLGVGFTPPPCVVATFADVPCSNPFAAWVEELVRRGITAGCLASEYCPRVPVQRAEMAVFLVRTFDLLR